MATIKEVLEDMQHRVTKDDPSDCNIPVSITVTTGGKFMLIFSLTSRNKVYNTLDELSSAYAKDWL